MTCKLVLNPDSSDSLVKIWENKATLKIVTREKDKKLSLELRTRDQGSLTLELVRRAFLEIKKGAQPAGALKCHRENDIIEVLRKRYLDGLSKQQKLALKQRILQKRSVSKMKTLSPSKVRREDYQLKVKMIKQQNLLNQSTMEKLSDFKRDNYAIRKQLEYVQTQVELRANSRACFRQSWQRIIGLTLGVITIAKLLSAAKEVKRRRKRPEVKLRNFFILKRAFN